MENSCALALHGSTARKSAVPLAHTIPAPPALCAVCGPDSTRCAARPVASAPLPLTSALRCPRYHLMPPPGDGLLPVVPSPTSISDPPPSADTVRKCGRLWRPNDPPAMALSPQHLNLAAVSLPEKRSLDIDSQSDLSAVLPSGALHFDAAVSSPDATLSSYASALGPPKPKKRRNWAPIAVVPMVKICLPTDVKPNMLLELKLNYQTMCSWESHIFMVSTLLSLVKCVLRPHADLKKIAALGRRLSKTRKRFLNAQRAVFDVQNERSSPPALPLMQPDVGASSKPLQQSPASSHQSLGLSEKSPKLRTESTPPEGMKPPPLPKKCVSSEIHGKSQMHRPRVVRPVAPRVSAQLQMQPQASMPSNHSAVPAVVQPAMSQCLSSEQQERQQPQHHQLASMGMPHPAISQPVISQPILSQQTLLAPRPKRNPRDSSAPIDTREIGVGYGHPSSGSQNTNEPSNDIVGSPIEQQWLAGAGTLDHEPTLSKMEPTIAEVPNQYPTHDFSPVTPGNTNRRVISVAPDAFAPPPGMGVPPQQAVSTPWESTSYSSSVTHMNTQAPDAPLHILSRLLAPSPSNLPFTPSTTVNPMTNPMNPMSGAMNNAPVTPVSFSPANISSAPNQMGVFDPGHSLLGRMGANSSSVMSQNRDLLSLTLDKTDLTAWDTPKESFGATGSWSRPKDPPPLPRPSFSDNPSPVPDPSNVMPPPNLPQSAMAPSNIGPLGLSTSGLNSSGVAAPGLAPPNMMQSTLSSGGMPHNSYSTSGILPSGMIPNNMVSNNLGPSGMSPGNLPTYSFEGGTDANAGLSSSFMDHRMGFYPTDSELRMPQLGATDNSHELFNPGVNTSGFFGAGSAPLPTTQSRGRRAGDREVVVPDTTSLLGPWQQAA